MGGTETLNATTPVTTQGYTCVQGSGAPQQQPVYGWTNQYPVTYYTNPKIWSPSSTGQLPNTCVPGGTPVGSQSYAITSVVYQSSCDIGVTISPYNGVSLVTSDGSQSCWKNTFLYGTCSNLGYQ